MPGVMRDPVPVPYLDFSALGALPVSGGSDNANRSTPPTTRTPPPVSPTTGGAMPQRVDTVAANMANMDGHAVVTISGNKSATSSRLHRALHIGSHTSITLVAAVVGIEFALLSADAVDETWQKVYFGTCSATPNTLGTMTAILSVIKLLKDLKDIYKNGALDRASKTMLAMSMVMTLSAVITSLPLANDSVDALTKQYIPNETTRNIVRWILAIAWAVGYTGSTRLSGAYALLNKLYDKTGLMERLEPHKHFLKRFTEDMKAATAELKPENIGDINTDFIVNFYNNNAVKKQLQQAAQVSCAARLKTAMTVALMTGCIQLLPFGMDLGARGTRLLPGGDAIPQWAVHMIAALAGLTFTIFYANSASLIVDRTEGVVRKMWKDVGALVVLPSLALLVALAYGSSKGMSAEANEFSQSDSPYNVNWFVFSAVYSGLVGCYAGGANGNFILGFVETIQLMMKKYDVTAPKAIVEALFSWYDLERKREEKLADSERKKEQVLRELTYSHNRAFALAELGASDIQDIKTVIRNSNTVSPKKSTPSQLLVKIKDASDDDCRKLIFTQKEIQELRRLLFEAQRGDLSQKLGGDLLDFQQAITARAAAVTAACPASEGGCMHRLWRAIRGSKVVSATEQRLLAGQTQQEYGGRGSVNDGPTANASSVVFSGAPF